METTNQLESDTVEYWKKQAKHYEQKATDIQQELDEYTENSAQLEKELDASLVRVEKENTDLKHQNKRVKNDIDMLKSKLERSQHESNALENELQTLKMEKEKQATYIRELEQKNDDLERAQRMITESVSYIETLLHQAYERNAILESEADEIENLRVKLQRATDEARDLKQELVVIEKNPISKKEESINENICNGHTARSQVEIETQTSLLSPTKRELNGNAMTPSSRVSAINIVGDLLRKIGLERFLCHDCGKVKCSCDVTTDKQNTVLETNRRENDPINNIDNSIEYRKGNFIRQYSKSEQSKNINKMPLTTPKSSEPLERSYQNENGRLRRSFIVRSREGIENMLNFSSSRKGQDQAKGKPICQQF